MDGSNAMPIAIYFNRDFNAQIFFIAFYRYDCLNGFASRIDAGARPKYASQ